MGRLIRAILNPKITVGEIYQFDDGENDPFGNKLHKVEVIDVKNKWVRYKWKDCKMFDDERMTNRQFNYCYKKVELC